MPLSGYDFYAGAWSCEFIALQLWRRQSTDSMFVASLLRICCIFFAYLFYPQTLKYHAETEADASLRSVKRTPFGPPPPGGLSFF
jgi:hypothetical protein